MKSYRKKKILFYFVYLVFTCFFCLFSLFNNNQNKLNGQFFVTDDDIFLSADEKQISIVKKFILKL